MQEELTFIETYGEQMVGWLAANGVGLVIAALIIIAGLIVGKGAAKVILKTCDKRNIDVTLARFFAGMAKLVLLGVAVVMALGRVGIEITPLIALIGAGAFGLTLAIQGPVSNYGAGIVIIITRPYKVGDTLSVHEVSGVVEEVNLGQTMLTAEDGECITIPNRKMLGEILVNSFNFRVIEGVVGIAYDDDPEVAINAISEALTTIPHLDAANPPEVGIQAFGESSVDIGYRVWAPSASYHKTLFAANLVVFKAVKKAGLTIPFPQRDVTLINAQTVGEE